MNLLTWEFYKRPVLFKLDQKMTLELETYPFPIHQKHPRRPTPDEEQKAPETKIQGRRWLFKNNWGFEVSFVCFVIQCLTCQDRNFYQHCSRQVQKTNKSFTEWCILLQKVEQAASETNWFQKQQHPCDQKVMEFQSWHIQTRNSSGSKICPI